jgi:hypothetical protein
MFVRGVDEICSLHSGHRYFVAYVVRISRGDRSHSGRSVIQNFRRIEPLIIQLSRPIDGRT